MSFSVTDIKPCIGSRVELDKALLNDPAVVASLSQLLERRGVLVFPQINLNDEEQLALTDKLGKRIYLVSGEEDSAIYKISLDSQASQFVEYVQATFFWHMDGLTADMIPPKATLLSAKSVAREGGQTEFANTYLAWERLSEQEKQKIDKLQVVHSMKASMFDIVDNVETTEAHWRQLQLKQHPLVWTHLSGRKSLVLAATGDHIVDMPRAQGRALLARLLQWTAQPEFCYSHEWQEGDLVIWDNCGTLHRVVPYDEHSGRMMHRTTIEGVEPLQ